jgi:hypothetical protein
VPEMDPIKNLISATDPAHNDRFVPDSEDALRRILSEPAAFTDTIPPNVTSLTDRRQRRARLAGILTLAAAAVTAGVLVTTNLGPLTTGAAPANTGSAVGTGSSTATATPTPSASVTPPASPAATPAATAPAAATGPAGPAGPVACTKDNVEGVQSWLAEQMPSMQVSGCAGGWMALSITATGGQMDGGSQFWMANLAGGKYVIDSDRSSAQVPGWEAAARNNDRLTAEQYMDGQFTAKGIPLELRKALVGSPAPGSLAARGLKTFVDRSTGYQASFTYPAAWQLADPSQSNSLANGAGISLTDSAGNEMARLALGDTNEWTSCLNEAPYKVIDTQPMPGLPFDPAAPSQGAPRFAYVAMTSAATDGGPVQAGIGITNRIAGQEGTACVLDFAVAGPGPLHFYSFSPRRPLGGPTWGLYRFQTLEEATAFTQTQSY